MRPWFMITVVIIIAFFGLTCWFVADFTLKNKEMFETTFNIVVVLPGWSHTWEGVQFIYILAGSIVGSTLVGALIVTFSILVLDRKRTLKLKNMRKEFKQLQEAQQKVEPQAEEELLPPAEEEEIAEVPDSSSATPEDIAKSFEDVIQEGDLLEKPQEGFEEEQIDEKKAGWDAQEGGDEGIEPQKLQSEQELAEEEGGYVTLGEEELVEETPIEAEIIEEEPEETLPQDEQEESAESETKKRGNNAAS